MGQLEELEELLAQLLSIELDVQSMNQQLVLGQVELGEKLERKLELLLELVVVEQLWLFVVVVEFS